MAGVKEKNNEGVLVTSSVWSATVGVVCGPCLCTDALS